MSSIPCNDFLKLFIGIERIFKRVVFSTMKTIILLFLSFSCFSQVDSLSSSTETFYTQFIQPQLPTLYYFPMYNDTQLIEIDYYTHTLREGIYMNTIAPRGGSWYADAVMFDQTNGYILRNSNGEILKNYGVINIDYIKLESVDSAQTITHAERLKMKRNVFGQDTVSWYDINGYGYRYAGMYVPVQRTEMPEMGVEVYGMIDTLGREVIPMGSRQISHFKGEYLVLKDLNYREKTDTIHSEINPWFTNVYYYTTGMYAIYDANFQLTLPYGSEYLERIGYNHYRTKSDQVIDIDRYGRLIRTAGE